MSRCRRRGGGCRAGAWQRCVGELTRHAANAVQRHVRRGWRLEKPDRSSPIDGMISLAMVLDRCEQSPEPVRLVGWV